MMNLVPIKDFAESIKTGKTPPSKEEKYFNGDINWFTPGDLDKEKLLNKSIRTITTLALDDKKAVLHAPGTLLIGCIGDIGKLGITTDYSSSNQQITGIYPNKDVDVEYLYYWFNGNKKVLEYFANNAVVPILNNKSLEKIQIPLPPLPEQKRIATILDEADKIRQLNKKLIEHYEQLSQSLFLEMFGDPVLNPMGWEKVPGNHLYEVRGRVGWKGYKKTDLRDSGPLVIGATHIDKFGFLDLSKPVYLSEEKFIESPEITVVLWDLIFVQRGNTIGKVGLIRENIGDATINPVVLILRPINVNPYFLNYLLLNVKLKTKILELNSGSAQPMITQGSMKEYNFIAPPLKIQTQFAERVQEIEQQKEQAEFSLQKSEELFQSLLQRAFRGEL